jgi:hypothetical protein
MACLPRPNSGGRNHIPCCTVYSEADAHATHAAHRRTAVCAGAKRAAAAAALEAQATQPEQQHQLRPGKEHNHSRAQQAKRTLAFRYAQSMFFPEAQPTSDASGTQH